MFGKLLNRAKQVLADGIQASRKRLSSWIKPPTTPVIRGGIRDLARSKPQLITENLLLRQQLVVLNRSVKRPRFTPADRGFFVLLASRLQSWKDALLIVKPETVLRWHRQGFRLFWKRTSQATSREPKVPLETITLIKEMAAPNRLWGAERIRGELLKVGIKVAKGS